MPDCRLGCAPPPAREVREGCECDCSASCHCEWRYCHCCHWSIWELRDGDSREPQLASERSAAEVTLGGPPTVEGSGETTLTEAAAADTASPAGGATVVSVRDGTLRAVLCRCGAATAGPAAAGTGGAVAPGGGSRTPGDPPGRACGSGTCTASGRGPNVAMLVRRSADCSSSLPASLWLDLSYLYGTVQRA